MLNKANFSLTAAIDPKQLGSITKEHRQKLKETMNKYVKGEIKYSEKNGRMLLSQKNLDLTVSANVSFIAIHANWPYDEGKINEFNTILNELVSQLNSICKDDLRISAQSRLEWDVVASLVPALIDQEHSKALSESLGMEIEPNGVTLSFEDGDNLFFLFIRENPGKKISTNVTLIGVGRYEKEYDNIVEKEYKHVNSLRPNLEKLSTFASKMKEAS